MARVVRLGIFSFFLLQACSEAEPETAPVIETAAAGISHASSGAFSNIGIPAGTTIWFNSEVRYSGLPNQVVHLYSNGGRITFSAGGVTYSLVVPDGNGLVTSRWIAKALGPPPGRSPR